MDDSSSPVVGALFRKVGKGTPEPTASWRDLEARFRALQPANGEGLCAHWISTQWSASGAKWYLSSTTDEGVYAQERFKWLAERAVVELGQSGGDGAWACWLDVLRINSRSFVGGIKRESTDSDGKTQIAETGMIRAVCAASANYCFKCGTDAKSASTGTGSPKVVSNTTDSEKKRGRPQMIPDARKVAAAKLKADGGTNQQAAAVIYDIKYPSPQQVKNVPAILRAYQQKISKQASSSIRTSPKPNKIRG